MLFILLAFMTEKVSLYIKTKTTMEKVLKKPTNEKLPTLEVIAC